MHAMKNPQMSIEPIWVRPSVACQLSGTGMTTLYQWIGSGRVESIKVGGKRLISVASIRRLGQGAEAAGRQPAHS